MITTTSKFRIWLEHISSREWLLAVILFSSLMFFAGLGDRQLWGADEPRIAGIATETAINGNWVEPRLNGVAFLETPPLFLWLESFSITQLGRTPLAVKLPAALGGILGVVGVFLLARRMKYSNFTAFLSALLLATSMRYWNNSRKGMTDILLCALVILAMWAFYCFSQSSTWRHRNTYFVMFAVMLGGAVLTKSLVGLAIPCAALCCWLAVTDFFINKKFSWINWCGLFTGALLSFIPVALWLLALYNASGYDAVYTVVWTNNFGRFIGSHAEHVEPFYYYLLKLPEQFQPWTIFLLAALGFYLYKIRKTLQNRQLLFILCWLIVPFLLLCISAGKRQVYLLPLYGAMALLTATALAPLIEGKILLPAKYRIESIMRGFAVVLAILTMVSPLILLVTVIILYVPIVSCMSQILCLIFSAGLVILGYRLKAKHNPTIIAIGILLGVATMYVSIDSVILKTLNYKNSTADIFVQAHKYLADGDEFYLFKPSERLSGGAVFYLGRTVRELDEEKLEKLRQSPLASKAIILAEYDKNSNFNNMDIVYTHKVKRDELVLLKFKK